MFLTFFALFFLALACWSFASPLVASPDEQAHIIRAVALDHGQLGHKEPGNKVVVDVTVPDSINFTKYYPQCWQFHSAIAATCSPPWPTSEAPVASTTYVGHYPPLYYLLVGTGSYVSQQKSGIYIMRLVSSAISAFMVALAFYVIAKWGRRTITNRRPLCRRDADVAIPLGIGECQRLRNYDGDLFVDGGDGFRVGLSG